MAIIVYRLLVDFGFCLETVSDTIKETLLTALGLSEFLTAMIITVMITTTTII